MVAHAGDDSYHGFLVGSASLRGANDVRRRERADARGRGDGSRGGPLRSCQLASAPGGPPASPAHAPPPRCNLSQIRLVRFEEDADTVSCTASFVHPGEVVGMAASPDDAGLVVTTRNALPGLRSTVWRMPGVRAGEGGEGEGTRTPGGEGAASELEVIADFPGQSSRVRVVSWAPGGSASASGSGGGVLASCDGSRVQAWTLRGDRSTSAALTPTSDCALPSAGDAPVGVCGGLAWDPHHSSELACATDGSVSFWDLRSPGSAAPRCIPAAVAAGLALRSLSYNPNKPWHLATAGDDHRVKIWDLRRLGAAHAQEADEPGAAQPVKVLDGHTHWVTAVAFNPFHDQLLVSGGSDARVGA